MNKQSIIGLVLIFAIFMGYIWWVSPSKEELAAMQAKHDSLVQVYNDSVALAAEEAAIRLELEQKAAQGDTAAIQQLGRKKTTNLGVFNAATTGDTGTLCIDNGLMVVKVSNQGAQVSDVVLSKYKTHEGKPLQLITPSERNMNLVFSTTDNRVVNTRELVFAPYIDGNPIDPTSSYTLNQGDSLTLSLRAYVPTSGNDNAANSEPSYLEFAYTFHHNSYEMGFDVEFHNLQNTVHTSHYLDFEWFNRMKRQEKVDPGSRGSRNRNKDRELSYTNLYFKPTSDKVDNLRMGRDASHQVKTAVEWVAYKQQFFCAILMTDSVPFENADLATHTDADAFSANKDYLLDMNGTIGLPFNNSNAAMHMAFYYGPTKYRDLRAMHKGFEKMLPLGWWVFSKFVSRIFIIPTFNFLERFNWNYGVIIIVFTILLRLLLFPLTFKSYQSSAIMRILRPEMEAINKKYPNQEQMMQKQQEMSKLQKAAGMNPMAGCLPMLIQMPVLTAMFMFYPVAIELRQQPFLWCSDLSTYDSILDFGFNIPLYGDHISLFCLLMFGMQFFYTWYTMRGQQAQANMPGMKFMMYFMPFFMLFMFNSQSAGLNLYYFCSLSITMLQMVLIRKFTSEKRVRARMAAYYANQKNKPQKKSRFQQQMERMQKMNEELERQRRK